MHVLFYVENMNNILQEFTPLFQPKTVAVIGANGAGKSTFFAPWQGRWTPAPGW